MYDIEVTFNKFTDHEHTVEETFPTLKMAIDNVKHLCKGRSAAVWINNKRLYPKNGELFDVDGNVVSIDPEWHQTAPERVSIPAESPFKEYRLKQRFQPGGKEWIGGVAVLLLLLLLYYLGK